MNKLGFHIMTANAANSDWIRRFNSAVHLVLAIGVGGEIPRLVNLAAANPKARFIYRAWTYGNFQSDHWNSYYKVHGTNPLPLIQLHEPVFDAARAYNDRISYQLFNETGTNENEWPHFVEFNRRFVVEMDRRGLSAAIFGLGPGNPGRPSREALRATWVQAKPLFEAIINAKQTHLINLHEYHAVPYTRFVPWVVGRYKMMLEDIRYMGLPTDKIKIVIGESGFTDPNALNYPSPTARNGYLWSIDQGHSMTTLAEDYMAMMREVYDPSPNIVGTCYYGLGSTPGWWEEFDLLRAPTILNRMEQLLVHNPQGEVTVIDTPVLKYVVGIPSLNIRSTPATNVAPVGSLERGAQVDTNGFIETNGYRWRRLLDGRFVAEYLLSAPTAPYLTLVPVTGKSEILAQLNKVAQELDALRALAEKL